MKLEFLELELHQKISMKLELYGKFEFHKLVFKKCGRFLIISQIMVDPYIFSQTMVLDHFGQVNKRS